MSLACHIILALLLCPSQDGGIVGGFVAPSTSLATYEVDTVLNV